MKHDRTEIIFIMDNSGSMRHLTDDTIGGFNGFLEEQKNVGGEAFLTTVLFNSTHRKLHDHIDIREVPELTKKQYSVGGMTAMLDAIGDTIQEVQERIDNTPEDERPAHIICAITTDGQENASNHHSKSEVQKMIEHQTKGHGWQFVFLGANMDAVSEASSLGITHSATYMNDSIGTQTLYSAVDCATKSVRACGEINTDWAKAVTDYAEATNATAKQ